MPSVNFKFIVSSSPSEQGYEADNLLGEGRPRTKWRGKPGSTTNSVVIQLERECCIYAVHIGNEFSALVEILVAKSCEAQSNFHTLIPSSSLMDPMESRTEKNGNRVRMFTDIDMIPAIEKQKWDLIKIVCSQPFNPNVAYGLSFVNVISDETAEKKGEKKKGTMPKLPLRKKNTLASNDLTKPGGMFRRFQLQNNDAQSSVSDQPNDAPVAARKRVNAYPRADAGENVKFSTPSRKRISDDDDGDSPQKGSNIDNKQPKSPIEEKPKRLKVAETSADSSDVSADSSSRTPSPGTSKEEVVKDTKNDGGKGDVKRPDAKKIKLKPNVPLVAQATAPSTNDVPLNQVLRGVRISISGYQNPRRSQIRDKARQLGAAYEANWNNSCTHLVCAFPNTPKWRQVGTSGKIVNDKWIEMCHMRKKRLPEMNFPV